MTLSPTLSVCLKNVGVVRGNITLFNGLSFDIRSGEVVWVQGSNGIGKTTLLRLITGLSQPSTGNINWTQNGIPCSPDGLVAYQGHRDTFKPNLTALQELRFWAKIYGYKSELAPTFEQVALADKQHLETRSLSAGQRRRLTIARLLISQKPLWIMDEPAAAMDVAGRELIYAIIKTHAQNGGAVMLASHETAEQLGITTKRLILSKSEGVSG